MHVSTPTHVSLTASQLPKDTDQNTHTTNQEPSTDRIACTSASDTYTLTLIITPQTDDAIYADRLFISCDAPTITLSAWQSLNEPITQYDTVFKKSKRLYTEPFTVTLTAQRIAPKSSYITEPTPPTQSLATITPPAKPPAIMTPPQESHSATPSTSTLPTNIHVIYYQKIHGITHAIIPLECFNTPTHIKIITGLVAHATAPTQSIKTQIKIRPRLITPSLAHQAYPVVIILASVITSILSAKRTTKQFVYALCIIILAICSTSLYLLNAAF